MIGLERPDTEVVTCPEPQAATYRTMGPPPDATGGSNLRAALVFPGVRLTKVGAPGVPIVPRGVAETPVDLGPAPNELEADTEHE